MEEVVYDTVVLDAPESAGEDLGMVLVHWPDFHGGDVVFVAAEDGVDEARKGVHGGYDVAAVVVDVNLALGSGKRREGRGRTRRPSWLGMAFVMSQGLL
jgi:hypothetical protein